MPTNAILFGNGGSGQVNNPTAVNFVSPFQTDQITDTVSDTNFWSSVRCNPVAVNFRRIYVDDYVYGQSYGNHLEFEAQSNVVFNKIFSVVIWDRRNTHSVNNVLSMWLYAPDDGYIPTGSTGFNLLRLQRTGSTYYTNVTTNSSIFTLKYPYTTSSKNKFSITWSGTTAYFGASNTASSGVYAEVRYI